MGSSCVIQRNFRFALLSNERFDFLLQLRHARAERHHDARQIFVLALDRVHVAGGCFDVDTCLRCGLGHRFERRTEIRQLLFMLPDLLLALVLLRFELLQIGDGRVLPRDELFLLLGIQSLLFRRHGEIALESVELLIGALAVAAPFAHLLLRRACALLGEDSRVIRGAQILFDRLQLRRDAAGARLLGAEERFEIGELALE